MEFRKVLALRGPNIWAKFPVLEAWVDLGAVKDSPSDELPGFNERLMAWLPTMIEHRCSVGERGGFFERLRRRDVPGAHPRARRAGAPGAGRRRRRLRPARGDLGGRASTRSPSSTTRRSSPGPASHAARELCLAAVDDRPFDVAAEVKRLRDLHHTVRLGPSTGAIVAAAEARGIPARRLNTESLVMLGQGARQKRIQTAETDRTGAIAESIAQDKELTREPAPAGRRARPRGPAGRRRRRRLGGRPGDRRPGRRQAPVRQPRPRRGHEPDDPRAGRRRLRQRPRGQLRDRRRAVRPGRRLTALLVVGGKLVAAARRDPAQVVGDGVHTVAQLVEEVNRDPRRGDGHATVLSKIELDPIALARPGRAGLHARLGPAGRATAS